eukprot:m.74401 g.74401  ORF g.74401 m.74401 type:complete len:54 (-) comp13941_c0_seq2:959-1120(-)
MVDVNDNVCIGCDIADVVIAALEWLGEFQQLPTLTTWQRDRVRLVVVLIVLLS